MKIVLLFSTLMVSTVDLQRTSERYTPLPYASFGELNAVCRSNRDCKPNAYLCRDNRTCQCANWYVPDKELKKCLGGVNQKCTYDEHCIQGAYCMNQSICQCKEDTPYASEDGLSCSKSRRISENYHLLLTALLALMAVHKYLAD